MIIKGLEKLTLKLSHMAEQDFKEELTNAALMVEAEAKQLCPRDTGLLADSITSEVEDTTAVIGTGIDYAPYVHQGTGIYAPNGGTRQGGYWVFIKQNDHSIATVKSSTGHSKTYATKEEARRAMYYLRSLGFDAYYTNGQRPQPFLTDALHNKENDIKDLFKKALKEEVND